MSYKSNDGFMMPLAILLLALAIFFISSYSVRYMVKLNTLDNIKKYYYNEIIKQAGE